MLKKGFILTVLLLYMTSLVLPASGTNADTTLVPDDALRVAINEQLESNGAEIDVNTHEPTKEELKTLKSLDAFNQEISNLNGLQYASNLEGLNLNGNQITDIEPLQGLTHLTNLSLSGNQITNIEPLKGLSNLTSLGLMRNDISDISVLSGLTNLKSLYLGNNQITDIPDLSGLTDLNELNLFNNQITDVTPLSDLKNLSKLVLARNAISNLSPLDDVVEGLEDQDFTHQSIELPEHEILEQDGTLTIENMIKGSDGKIIHNITPSNEGIYEPPEIKWTGLEYPKYYVSFTFESADGHFSGNVSVPLNWNRSPEIKAKDVTITAGDSFNLLDHVTAGDWEDGDLTSEITVTKNNVDPTTPGDYQVSYEVSDSSDQTATEDIAVTVKPKDAITIPFDVETNVYADQKVTIEGTNAIVTMPSDMPQGRKIDQVRKTKAVS